MLGPRRKYQIHGRKRLLDNFFKVDEVEVSYEQVKGGMGAPQKFLVFERGDAVAALLHDPEKRVVILVDQFRLPTLDEVRGSKLEPRLGDGWLLETPAGMIKQDETPEQCLVREAMEETGYQATKSERIASFFSSPGGSTERIFLYYAQVRKVDRTAPGGGDGSGGEDIRIIEMPIEELFRRLSSMEIEDPKLLIAALWLRERESRRMAEADESTSKKIQYRLNGTSKIVGYRTGSILAVKDVDVWVNSENSDMIMDRFFGRSVSAAIRANGAERFPKTKRIKQDTIADALRKEMNGRSFAALGTVIETTSGMLASTHKVKRLFHVAAVEGEIGEGLKTSIETLELCIDKVLATIDTRGRRTLLGGSRYRSVLIPMIGTGQGGFEVAAVAPKLIARAVEFLKANPQSGIEEIYLSAYSLGDADVCERALSKSERLEPVGSQQGS